MSESVNFQKVWVGKIDGLVVDEWLYPFVVDCPVQYCEDPECCDSSDCVECDGTGELRNPALEWVWHCFYWGDCTSGMAPSAAHKLCQWLAVGVKRMSPIDYWGEIHSHGPWGNNVHTHPYLDPEHPDTNEPHTGMGDVTVKDPSE